MHSMDVYEIHSWRLNIRKHYDDIDCKAITIVHLLLKKLNLACL